jgi:DNA-binding transcriptional LysR family regulator
MSSRRIWTLRISWLAAFVSAAEHGSQIEAANLLGCDQSTVSRYIKDLQDWLGKKLFISSSPFKLSAHGEDFLPIAKVVIELLMTSQSEEFTRDIGIAGADIDMSWWTPPAELEGLMAKARQHRKLTEKD